MLVMRRLSAGLTITSVNPLARSSSASDRPVNAITGTCGIRARIWRSTSVPSMSARLRSSSTRSSSSDSASIAWLPVSASTTHAPSAARVARTYIRVVALSSTTRIRWRCMGLQLLRDSRRQLRRNSRRICVARDAYIRQLDPDVRAVARFDDGARVAVVVLLEAADRLRAHDEPRLVRRRREVDNRLAARAPGPARMDLLVEKLVAVLIVHAHREQRVLALGLLLRGREARIEVPRRSIDARLDELARVGVRRDRDRSDRDADLRRHVRAGCRWRAGICLVRARVVVDVEVGVIRPGGDAVAVDDGRVLCGLSELVWRARLVHARAENNEETE